MKRHAPAAARNVVPIGEVLDRELPQSGLVLEIASGSGEHAMAFARRFPALVWQPSDPDLEALASIASWREDAQLPNLRAPVALDAASETWPIASAAALICINMVHISPWSATEGLVRGAARLLAEGAPLVLYGPFFERTADPAASNLAFDASLKARDPSWGLRQVEDVDRLAQKHGFARTARHEMPANNLMLIYRWAA